MSGYLRRLVSRSLRTTPTIRSELSLPFATLPSFDDTTDIQNTSHAESGTALEHSASRNHISSPENHFSNLQEDKSRSDVIDATVPDDLVGLHRKPRVDLGHKSPLASDDPISKESFSNETKWQISVNNVHSDPDIFQEQTPRLTKQSVQLKASIQSRKLPNDSAENKSVAGDTSINPETNNAAVTSLVEDTFPFSEDTSWQRQASQAKVERSAYREPPPRLVDRSTAETQNPRQQSSISAYDKRKLGNNVSYKQTHEEPTEVHVTIGRIEVTAVHAPPAAKRQSEPVNKLMSLDEYLANRQKGRI